MFERYDILCIEVCRKVISSNEFKKIETAKTSFE